MLDMDGREELVSMLEEAITIRKDIKCSDAWKILQGSMDRVQSHSTITMSTMWLPGKKSMINSTS